MSNVVTPGTDRVFRFIVRGQQFGYRWPSRAEEGDIADLTALKLSRFGPSAAALLNKLDGNSRQWESRLEIGLMRRLVNGQVASDRGETAPAHWIYEERGADGKITDRRISFEDVMPEEFDEVVAAIETERSKKKNPPPETSGPTVTRQTSA